jgi:hypothetical protein
VRQPLSEHQRADKVPGNRLDLHNKTSKKNTYSFVLVSDRRRMEDVCCYETTADTITNNKKSEKLNIRVLLQR